MHGHSFWSWMLQQQTLATPAMHGQVQGRQTKSAQQIAMHRHPPSFNFDISTGCGVKGVVALASGEVMMKYKKFEENGRLTGNRRFSSY
mmetsp:Transcript_45225/g.79632  ORF Transcript_45225/g.79632 Transcript_45225/m.79632 type:complete len:89 (+) Transcript_45225:379-645(+)